MLVHLCCPAAAAALNENVNSAADHLVPITE
jgi:hypothetical protein